MIRVQPIVVVASVPAVTVISPELQLNEGEVISETVATYVYETHGSDGISTLSTVVLRDGQVDDFDFERIG